MKRWFSALPIHRKLMALALGVSAVALTLSMCPGTQGGRRRQ